MLRIVVLAQLVGCFPYAIPPLKGELGAATQDQQAPAGRVAGGASLASGTLSKRQKLDVGLGGFYEWTSLGRRAAGAYGDVAVFIDRGEHTRTSLGFRGELRYDEMSRAGSALKLRIDHELYGSTTKSYSGSDHCSAIFGTAYGSGGVGLYVEAGPALLPDSKQAFLATAGITLRMPATVGLLVGIPGC